MRFVKWLFASNVVVKVFLVLFPGLLFLFEPVSVVGVFGIRVAWFERCTLFGRFPAKRFASVFLLSSQVVNRLRGHSRGFHFYGGKVYGRFVDRPLP